MMMMMVEENDNGACDDEDYYHDGDVSDTCLVALKIALTRGSLAVAALRP